MANFKPRTPEQKRAQSLRMRKYHAIKKAKYKRLKRLKNTLVVVCGGLVLSACVSVPLYIIHNNKTNREIKDLTKDNKDLTKENNELKKELIKITNLLETTIRTSNNSTSLLSMEVYILLKLLNGKGRDLLNINRNFWLGASLENFKKYVNEVKLQVKHTYGIEYDPSRFYNILTKTAIKIITENIKGTQNTGGK